MGHKGTCMVNVNQKTMQTTLKLAHTVLYRIDFKCSKFDDHENYSKTLKFEIFHDSNAQLFPQLYSL